MWHLKFSLPVLALLLSQFFSCNQDQEPRPPWVTSQEGARYKHWLPVMDVAFSRDGHWLASCGRDAKIELYDLRSGKFRTVGALYTVVTGVAFSPDSRRLASISMSGEILLLDVATQRQLLDDSSKGTLGRLAFSPDGRLLAGGYVEFVTGRMHVIPPLSPIRAGIWDATTLRLLATFEGPTRPISALAFSQDGRSLFTGYDDGTVNVWHVEGGPPVRTMRFYHSGILAFGPDGRWIASRDEDGAEVLDLNDGVKGQRVFRLEGHGNFNDVTTAAFSPDGRLLASGDEHANIIIWDVSTGHMLRRLTGHTDSVNSVAFSPDGSMLASAGNDKTVRIWEVASGREIHHW